MQMMGAPFREEVLNVELARLLLNRALVSAPETIAVGPGRVRRLPDVVVTFRGLRVVIEGKTSDTSDAHNVVAKQAHDRVAEALAQIAIGVVYPADLRTESFERLPGSMAKAQLDIQVHTEAGAGPWLTADGVDALAGILTRTYEQLVSEDVVADAVDLIETGIADFVAAVRAMPSGMERLADLLEVRESTSEAPDAD